MELFLIVLVFQLSGGVNGQEDYYHKLGDDVKFKCETLDDCTSITCLFSRDPSVTDFKEIELNISKPAKGSRLVLGPDCSLTVHNVTAEDAGFYNCRRFYSHGHNYYNDKQVSLSLLTVTQSPPAASMRKSRAHLTLTCSFFSYNGCNHGVKWLKEDTQLKEEHFTQPSCESHLNVTKQDNNTRFRCQLNKYEGKFADFTPLFPGGNAPKTTPGTGMSDLLHVFIAVGGALALSIVILLIVAIRRRRNAKAQSLSPATAGRGQTGPGVSTRVGQTEHGDESGPSDGLTYASIDHSKKKAAPGGGAWHTVTYATVKTAERRT